MSQQASRSTTSTSLLEAARRNDRDAWHRLVWVYGPLVVSWAQRAGLHEHDAADVAQDVFRSVAAHLGDFRRDRPTDSFRGWLYTIAQNCIRDYFRRRQKTIVATGGSGAYEQLAQHPEDDSSADDLDAVAASDHVLLVRRIIELVQAEFEPRTWQAFWQAMVEGQSAAEVGAKLGMTSAAVYKAKSRVLARIRREFGELVDNLF